MSATPITERQQQWLAHFRAAALFSADLFIFCNRARSLVKMVAWEGNGVCLWMTRLEKSGFKWLLSGSDSVLQLTVQEINWLLEPHQREVVRVMRWLVSSGETTYPTGE